MTDQYGRKTSAADYTEADIDAMSEDELDAFLALYAPGTLDVLEPKPASEHGYDDADEFEPAMTLSNEYAQYLDLTNPIVADAYLAATDEDVEGDLDLSATFSTPAESRDDDALLDRWIAEG